MRRFPLARFLLLALSCSPHVLAQLPQNLERCLPRSTLAHQIDNSKADAPAKSIPAPGHPARLIDSVQFLGVTKLPPSIQNQLIASIRNLEFDTKSVWLENIQQKIHSTWQNYGYFTAQVEVEIALTAEDAMHRRYAVTARINEGHQYRLWDVQYARVENGPLLFPEAELRSLLHLNDGDILDVSKIRESIAAMHESYGTKGYMDMTASPITSIDEDLRRVSLKWEIEEGRQYRVGTVEILGLNPQQETRLKALLKPGDILDYRLIRDFYRNTKSSLIPNLPPTHDFEIFRDPENSTINLRFDFRNCPQLPN